MADEEQLTILKQGVEAWNAWRNRYPDVRPDLNGATLYEANLTRADLRKADLYKANLYWATLYEANLTRADLSGATLRVADLTGATLYEANVSGANLYEANLTRANLTRANLIEANLQGVLLVDTCLANTNLTNCRIYGMSAWGLNMEGATQKDLIITREDQSKITVDNLEVAQFIHLLLHNEKIRDVIDTITSKVVLILGRFEPERKIVLDALREKLRQRNYLPVLFDFDKSVNRDITETVSLLARMARFIVADITDARSIPQELGVIVPGLPSVPVQPLLLAGADEYGMFEHFQRYPWVLETYVYASADELIANLGERVIGPAEAKAGR
jgi:hypothetical protein